ncbi:putative transposase (plasmid) [Fischerella sp. NIES-4106]|nr:putative transposase [Fischerella sp. NIES-4106]
MRKYKDGGRDRLLEVKHAPGKLSIVSEEALKRLKQRLQEPQGFHSYSQIQQWLIAEFQLDIAYKTVYEIVRYRIGAKLKVPRPKAPNNIHRVCLTLKKTSSSIQILAGGIWRGEAIEVLVPRRNPLGTQDDHGTFNYCGGR